jgi:putative transcriptional regulator
VTIWRHPSDETLMRHAAGRLSPALSLTVAVHLESCAACRENVRLFEAAGGALLADLKPAKISDSSLERLFARIDSGEVAPAPRPRPAPPTLSNGFVLPAAMAGCDIGPWRSVAPGLGWARVRLPGAPKERAVLLKIAAGKAAPMHDHRGLELTQVLYGRFSDGRGTYGPGDLVEADVDTRDHQPLVTEDGECLCLAALEAPLRIHSLIGRLFQPLMGI